MARGLSGGCLRLVNSQGIFKEHPVPGKRGHGVQVNTLSFPLGPGARAAVSGPQGASETHQTCREAPTAGPWVRGLLEAPTSWQGDSRAGAAAVGWPGSLGSRVLRSLCVRNNGTSTESCFPGSGACSPVSPRACPRPPPAAGGGTGPALGEEEGAWEAVGRRCRCGRSAGLGRGCGVWSAEARWEARGGCRPKPEQGTQAKDS